jgi:esterase/lipase
VAWARPGERTQLSLIYVHGFSASGREVSPLPERVAEGLGANLFLARLAGHGQDGAAMGEASLRDWRADMAEALAIGRALGERVLVMACSTGCTLVALALAEGEPAAGAILLSPNFGLASRRIQLLLDLPVVRTVVPRLVPGTRGEPAPGAAGLWTQGWPARALIPMAATLRAARRSPLDHIRAPALFAFSDRDRVVDPVSTRAAMARWGAPVTHLALAPTPGGDPMNHVPAGALNPGGTEPLARASLAWARAL